MDQPHNGQVFVRVNEHFICCQTVKCDYCGRNISSGHFFTMITKSRYKHDPYPGYKYGGKWIDLNFKHRLCLCCNPGE